MSSRTRLTGAAAALALSVPMLLTACSNSSHPARVTPSARPHAENSVPPTVTLTPAMNSRSLPVTSEIGANVLGGVVTAVTLTGPAGRTVNGAWRSDGSSWVPATSLEFGAKYTAKIVATAAGGATHTSTTSFTTMSAPKTKPISTTINVTGGETYGVGMPVVLTFGTEIAANQRASIERRLFVQSNPPQTGIWSWVNSTEVVYRPQVYWKTGSSITVRTALDGMPIGTRVVGKDHSATFAIGKDQEFLISNKKHNLTVMSGGKAIHTYPISMGRPGASTTSWSGNFVIMQRYLHTVFNTLGIPGENYLVAVNYAERLTWSGTYIHSAPWSVYAQGHYNVSHGCVNVGPSNAAWIYKNSQVGDPVSITGTGRPVVNGNGWTAWSLSWADFVKGSALGYAQSRPTRQNTPTE